MTLAQEISDFQAGFLSHRPAETLALFAENTEQLVRSGKCDRLLAGWRSDVIGNKLLATMQTRD